MYPYLFAEHNLREQREQLTRTAERHRVFHADRPQASRATGARVRTTIWLRWRPERRIRTLTQVATRPLHRLQQTVAWTARRPA
jgi:hypothetical protein